MKSKALYGAAGSTYPKHLHNTHLIPPIGQREKGVKAKALSSIKSKKQERSSSDGFRDRMTDGLWKTTHPVYLTKKWVEQGSKRGLY